MANSEQVAILRQGIEAWNEWRISNPQIEPNLEGVSFGGVQPGGFDLSRAKLRLANCRDVNFGNCNLTQADLRDAVLCGADLSGVSGFLLPQQFAGADLTGAKLPDSLRDTFRNLDVAKGISDNAQKLFVAMLAACLYSWLTIATTTDINLITNRASSPLPIIQTSIPIVGFYFVAPLLLLGVYYYFHLYLQKLWEEMGSLPAIFPDGRALPTKADPWLLSDLVRSHVSKLRPDRPFLSYLQKCISIVLAWWVVPITLGLFWARYLRRHEMFGTALHCVLTAICITGAVFLYRLASATLRGDVRGPFVWKLASRHLSAWRPAAFAVTSASVLALFSFAVAHSARVGVPGRDWWPPKSGAAHWIPAAMEALGFSPFADLRGADLSSRPASPAGTTDSKRSSADQETNADSRAETTVDSIQGLRLNGVDLRYADMRSSSLRGTVLTDAHLEWADLLAADLTGSELAGAHMEHADLLGAHLKNADLSGAHFNGANLRLAELVGSELQYADLTGTQGLTHDALTSARNWCNAVYDPDFTVTLGLPTGNTDRIRRWRKNQEAVAKENNGAAEAARLEQLSRLFPKMNDQAATTLERLLDPTLDQTPAPEQVVLEQQVRALASIPWPDGMAPIAAPMDPPPDPEAALPPSDYIIVTWTVAEAAALAAVLSPGHEASTWYPYRHLFDSKFRARIAARAPASQVRRLGRYFPARIGARKVILFKSDLHFTQDGPALPLVKLFEQVIRETGAKLVITTGTAGAVGRGLLAGDVVVSSTCVFRCKSEFQGFNGKTVTSAVHVPTEQIEVANQTLFQANASQLSAARKGMPQVPQIYWDNTPQPNIVVTTDYFALDDARDTQKLQCAGSVVEEDDAVLGLACQRMGAAAPKWLSVRNISLPQLSGYSVDRERRAAALYIRYGFWTTVQSAVATWAIIAGTP